MNWLERIMELSIGFFIIVTGVVLAPQVLEVSTRWFTSIYSISIILSSVYFLWKGISKRFVKDKNSELKRDKR